MRRKVKKEKVPHGSPAKLEKAVKEGEPGGASSSEPPEISPLPRLAQIARGDLGVPNPEQEVFEVILSGLENAKSISSYPETQSSVEEQSLAKNHPTPPSQGKGKECRG
ncbi:hypothetical protein KI387_040738, partial [Taxus chinensis]